jgi:hypothetical protein
MTVGIALKELWISFRLLAVLVLFAAAGVLAATAPLLPAIGLSPEGGAAALYARALAVAAAGAAALGGTAFAGERRRGGLGWLAARSIPRSLLLLGWFAALAGLVLVGMLPSAMLTWLAMTGEPAFGLRGVSPVVFGVALLAAMADAVAWIAAGLLVGIFLTARLAGAVILLLLAALLLLGTLVPSLATYLPGAGIALLAEAGSGSSGLEAGLRAGGVGLLITALLLAVGIVTLRRRDL